MLNRQTTRQLHQHSESVAPGCGFLLSCRRRGGERWFSSFMWLSIILLLPQIFWLHCFPEIQLSQNGVNAFGEDRSVKESLFGLHGCYIWIAVWEVFTIIYLKVVMPEHVRKSERKTAVGSNLVLLHCFYYYCITITDAGLRTANWNYFIL